MDKTLIDSVPQVKYNTNTSEGILEYDSLLPIENEDQLNEFGSKLNCKYFRKNIAVIERF